MLVLLLLMILWPLAEIYVAVLVAQALGVLQMLALVALASIGGLFVIRNESRTAWVRFNQAMNERRLPSREVGDGLIGFTGGVMMLVPGLISGAIGLLLILPPVKALARWLVGALVVRRFGLTGSAAAWSYTYVPDRPADIEITVTAEEIHDEATNTGSARDSDTPRLPPS